MSAQLHAPEDHQNRCDHVRDSFFDEAAPVEKEPETACDTCLDSLFDDKFRAPCIIHSDDLSDYGTIKTPPVVSALNLGRWEARQFNLYLFAPLTSNEHILARRNFITALKQLPNFDELWKELRETTNIIAGLDGILSIQDDLLETSALHIMHNYNAGCEAHTVARATVVEGCASLERGRESLQRLLTILPHDIPILQPLYQGFLKLAGVVRPFETLGVIEGLITEREIKAMTERIGSLMDRATFLFGMAKIIRDFGLNPGTCNDSEPEQYTDGWNLFYLETRDQRNPSPAAEPVIGFAGDNNSGKSVSGVHQNMFIQIIWQSTGFSCIGSGNFRIYDSFMLADRARTHHEMGDNAMGAEMRMYREVYPLLGRRFMLGLDEAFSTMSPEDQVLFLKGLGICARERQGKTFLATHSELFPEEVEGLPGFKIYHFLTTNEPDGRPKYHYVLTPGARGSNAIPLARAMKVIPQIVEYAEQSAQDQLRWTGVKPVDATPAAHVSTPGKKDNFIFVRHKGKSALKVFTLDPSLRANPLHEQIASYDNSQMRWDYLATHGSPAFLQDFLLQGVGPSAAEMERRQAIFRAAAERWDVEGIQKSIAGLATLASMHEAIPDQVVMLRAFNRHINPLTPNDNRPRNSESLRLACRYLALTRKLSSEGFKESQWIDEGPALEDALARYETARKEFSLRDIAKRINTARDLALTLDELATVKEMLEACDDAALVPSITTRGHVSDYKRNVGNDGSGTSLVRGLLDALSPKVAHTDGAQGKTEEQKKEKSKRYQDWFWANFSKSVHLHSLPEAPNFSAISQEIPNSTINAQALDEVPLGELERWILEQNRKPASAGKQFIYYSAARASEIATEFLNTSLTASEIELAGPYDWQSPGATYAQAKSRLDSIISEVSKDSFSKNLPAVNLFKFDVPPLAPDIMPLLTPKNFYNPTAVSLSAHGSVEWSLTQLLDASKAPPNIYAQLRSLNIPELDPIIDELESIISTLGVPNGENSAYDLLTSKKIERDPLKFWQRYHAIVEIFLTAEQFAAGKAAYAAKDTAGVSTVLDAMRTTSISQIVRGYGALFETRYAKRLQDLDGLKKQMDELAQKTPFEEAGVNIAVAELLSGSMPPTQQALSLAEAFAKYSKTSIDEVQEIGKIAALDERRRRFKEYCTNVIAAHDNGKAALKFLEDAKPLFDGTREIAKQEKVLKQDEVHLLPDEVSIRLRARYTDEAQKLFAFSYSRLNRMNALLSEIRSIGVIAKALRDGERCLVNFNDDGRITVKGLRETSPSFNDKTVPQDYDFGPEAPGETLNGPNRSGKTQRSKMLAKGVTEALIFGVAPAEHITIPRLNGVVYVDRVTTKSVAKYGSAGNEFLIWSRVLPEIVHGKHLVVVDEAYSTMNPSDQSNFVPAMGVAVLESGNFLEFSCHNRPALQKLVATGVPVVPRFLDYAKDPTTGNLTFSYKIRDGYAPSEAVSVALELNYPWEFLAGVLPPERKPPEQKNKRHRDDWG